MTFKEMLSSDESLFLNHQHLEADFTPPIIKYRENEQNYIATCIRPLLQGRTGKHLLITGDPGIGKTLATKHILSTLQEETNDVYALYVNCWKKDTPHKVLLELCAQLQYKWVMNKNFDELLRAVSELINHKSAVIVLDEADKIQDYSLLYSLLESLHKKSLILISNTKHLLSLLDTRISSRLMPSNLDFRAYTRDEIRGILQERAQYAFVRNVLSKECLDLIVERTFESGDLRTGLFLLKESGELAEAKSLRSISLEHTAEALSKLPSLSQEDQSHAEERSLLQLIKEHDGKNMGELFSLYESQTGKSYRTFQRKIKDLEKGRLIQTKEVNGGNDGRTRIVSLSQNTLKEF